MAAGDWFELTLFATLYGETIINRWHYEQTAGGGNGALALQTAFQASVLDDIANLQSDDMAYNRVLAQNLNTPADNSEDVLPTPPVGNAVQNGTPKVLALSYRSLRPDLSKRYSYKRFAGIDITLLGGNQWNVIDGKFAALAAAMTSTITSSGNTFKPVQLKFVYPGGGLPPVITKNYDITGWTVIGEPTTQDTRKANRGI